jgi:GTP-binding protein HflX
LPTNQNVLLSDTVGFIRKLPHGLVEAFKATLEEVVHADLLVHVVDLSHPQAEEQIVAVNLVLEEIGAGGKPTLMAFNKVDRLPDPAFKARFTERFPGSAMVSARTGEGTVALLDEIGTRLRPIREFVELAVPYGDSAVIARLHKVAQVIATNYDGAEKALLRARIPPYLHAEFAAFIVKEL